MIKAILYSDIPSSFATGTELGCRQTDNGSIGSGTGLIANVLTLSTFSAPLIPINNLFDMFYIDYHITAIRWTSVGIRLAWTVLLAAAFIYAIFVKKQRDYRLYK